MTWTPTVNRTPARRRAAARRRARVLDGAAFRARRRMTGRGRHRIFNAAEYRVYVNSDRPPQEGDAATETNGSLPYTTTATFGDGAHYVSLSWFNGVLDSGLLPIGAGGETYVRLDVSGGVGIDGPPKAPLDWRLERRSGGVVRMHAVYREESSTTRATFWAIAYSSDGSTPAGGSPDAVVAIPDQGLAVLQYDLPAVADGLTLRVRLQTVRGASYSEGSEVKSLVIDRTGPTAPLVLEAVEP